MVVIPPPDDPVSEEPTVTDIAPLLVTGSSANAPTGTENVPKLAAAVQEIDTE